MNNAQTDVAMIKKGTIEKKERGNDLHVAPESSRRLRPRLSAGVGICIGVGGAAAGGNEIEEAAQSVAGGHRQGRGLSPPLEQRATVL